MEESSAKLRFLMVPWSSKHHFLSVSLKQEEMHKKGGGLKCDNLSKMSLLETFLEVPGETIASTSLPKSLMVLASHKEGREVGSLGRKVSI